MKSFHTRNILVVAVALSICSVFGALPSKAVRARNLNNALLPTPGQEKSTVRHRPTQNGRANRLPQIRPVAFAHLWHFGSGKSRTRDLERLNDET